MMSFGWTSKEQVKKHAQIFTPPGAVFEMILHDGILETIQGVDKTILDPAVGEGQYPCSELVWKMFYNIDRLDEELALRALTSLYAIDIQKSSVLKAREHMKLTLVDAYKFFTGKDFPMTELEPLIDALLERNFIVGDSVKIMKQWSNPQQTLF